MDYPPQREFLSTDGAVDDRLTLYFRIEALFSPNMIDECGKERCPCMLVLSLFTISQTR